MLNVVTVQQAIESISTAFTPPRSTETLPLLESLGRVAAHDICSAESLPSFDRSTVDGFVVRAEDTFGASGAQPAYLRLIGEVRMGEAARMELLPGTTVRVATGGCLPVGANAVVMIEDTAELPDQSIEITRSVAPGDNLIHAGEDAEPDTLIVRADDRVRPQDIGFCAGLGITELQVLSPLRLGILSTGSEIVAADTAFLPCGMMRDVNAYAVGGLAKNVGIETELLGLVHDDAEAIHRKVAEGLERNDIVVVSGGSSVGTRDHTEEVLSRLGGFQLLFHGISVKPGKPTLAATNGRQLVVGLPGHPASALVVFDNIILPAVQVQLNQRVLCRACLSANLSSSPGREEYVRVKLRRDGDREWADPVHGKSGLISTITASDGYVVIPLDANGIEQGSMVDVVRYRECI